jgi:hypothetical protein
MPNMIWVALITHKFSRSPATVSICPIFYIYWEKESDKLLIAISPSANYMYYPI